MLRLIDAAAAATAVERSMLLLLVLPFLLNVACLLISARRVRKGNRAIKFGLGSCARICPRCVALFLSTVQHKSRTYETPRYTTWSPSKGPFPVSSFQIPVFRQQPRKMQNPGCRVTSSPWKTSDINHEFSANQKIYHKKTLIKSKPLQKWSLYGYMYHRNQEKE